MVKIKATQFNCYLCHLFSDWKRKTHIFFFNIKNRRFILWLAKKNRQQDHVNSTSHPTGENVHTHISFLFFRSKISSRHIFKVQIIIEWIFFCCCCCCCYCFDTRTTWFWQFLVENFAESTEQTLEEKKRERKHYKRVTASTRKKTGTASASAVAAAATITAT